jgi:hypothetical protein
MRPKIPSAKYTILANRLRVNERYFERLLERMLTVGFVPSDNLFQLALKAQAAITELRSHAEYAAWDADVQNGP